MAADQRENMDPGKPTPKRELRPRPPKWSSPLWFLPLMLIALWMWQSMIAQFAYRSIPYSEFKDRLERKEVVECTVKEDAIEGKIEPKPRTSPEKSTASPATNAAPTTHTAAQTKAFFF